MKSWKYFSKTPYRAQHPATLLKKTAKLVQLVTSFAGQLAGPAGDQLRVCFGHLLAGHANDQHEMLDVGDGSLFAWVGDTGMLDNHIGCWYDDKSQST